MVIEYGKCVRLAADDEAIWIVRLMTGQRGRLVSVPFRNITRKLQGWLEPGHVVRLELRNAGLNPMGLTGNWAITDRLKKEWRIWDGWARHSERSLAFANMARLSIVGSANFAAERLMQKRPYPEWTDHHLTELT